MLITVYTEDRTPYVYFKGNSADKVLKILVVNKAFENKAIAQEGKVWQTIKTPCTITFDDADGVNVHFPKKAVLVIEMV